MDRGANDIELKHTILDWLELNERMDALKFERLNYSRFFYASHSFTGGMLGRDEMQQYNSPISPEYGAMRIISKEKMLDRRIEVCKKKIELFSEYLSSIDQQKLIEAIKLDYVTELEHQAFEAIGEIEYYLEQHYQAYQLKKYYTLNKKQQKEMDVEGNTLLNRIKELAI